MGAPFGRKLKKRRSRTIIHSIYNIHKIHNIHNIQIRPGDFILWGNCGMISS